jgi:hypothetical protein
VLARFALPDDAQTLLMSLIADNPSFLPESSFPDDV